MLTVTRLHGISSLQKELEIITQNTICVILYAPQYQKKRSIGYAILTNQLGRVYINVTKPCNLSCVSKCNDNIAECSKLTYVIQLHGLVVQLHVRKLALSYISKPILRSMHIVICEVSSSYLLQRRGIIQLPSVVDHSANRTVNSKPRTNIFTRREVLISRATLKLPNINCKISLPSLRFEPAISLTRDCGFYHYDTELLNLL